MAPAASAGPIRTCVGCRGRGPRSQLLRVVAVISGDSLVLRVDQRRSMPGRGAWVHPRLDCFDLAVRRRAFGRALRAAAPPDPTEARAQVAATEHDSVPPPAAPTTERTESGFDADEHAMSTQQ